MSKSIATNVERNVVVKSIAMDVERSVVVKVYSNECGEECGC